MSNILKICPLLAVGEVRVNGKPFCVEDKCAWWHSRAHSCAMLDMVDNLMVSTRSGALNFEDSPH